MTFTRVDTQDYVSDPCDSVSPWLWSASCHPQNHTVCVNDSDGEQPGPQSLHCHPTSLIGLACTVVAQDHHTQCYKLITEGRQYY